MDLNILVVEDDAVQRHQVKRALAADGYTVFDAPDGGEAIRILAEHVIDLVLTDLKMPVVDGIALFNHVKKHYSGVPVGIFTASPDVLGNLEPDGFLCKPFGQEQLQRLVQGLRQRVA
jgi:CheY-like chemotaxis protein